MASSGAHFGVGWHSLRWRFTGLISGLCLTVLVVVLFAAHREVEATLVQSASDRAKQAADQVATIMVRSTQQTLDQKTRITPAVRDYLRDPSEAHLEIVRATLAPLGASQSHRITVWSAAGRRMLVLPEDAPADPAFVPAPQQAPGPGIAPMQSLGDRVLADIVIPIEDSTAAGKTVLGSVAIRATISITPPDALNRLVGMDARILFGNRSGDVWTDTTHVVAGPPIDAGRGGVAEYRSPDGVDRLGAIGRLAGTPWVVWVEFERAAVTARAATFLRRMATFGLLIAIATALLARWFAFRMTTPLMAITSAAEAMAGGDYSRHVAAEREDEIGRLSRAFNTMTDRVANAQRDLEEQVEARTEDLNAALAALDGRSRQRETYLATVVDGSADAIVSKDLDGNVTSWNRAAEQIFGYSASEMLGTSILRLVPPDLLDEEARVLAMVRRGESAERFETVRLAKDGRRLDVSLTMSPIKDVTGRIIGVSKVARDVTEHRKLQAQYQQAQKMEAVGRLAGGVAHDFNNLLTVILGHCELLLQGGPVDRRTERSATGIRSAANQAASLTRQLLAFSRKQIIEPTLVDLNAVVTEMRPMLTRLIGEDIEILVDLSSDLGVVKADRGQLEQVVMNLAVNARDAMPQGGVLAIKTANVELDHLYAVSHLGASVGPHVVLTVTDSGVGMSAEIQARVFEPFFTTKERGQGTGLGLATVHGIVSSSGGSVGIYSEIGKGTSFKVYLPKASEHGTAVEVTAAPARPHTGSETILVVEDSDQLRGVVQELLERQGYVVLIAASAGEARQLFDRHPRIDIVLTDVIMPGASGPELSRQLTEQRPDLRVIYMSGYTEEAIVRHGVLQPGIAFLHKPFTSETLGEKIREVLDA